MTNREWLNSLKSNIEYANAVYILFMNGKVKCRSQFTMWLREERKGEESYE